MVMATPGGASAGMRADDMRQLWSLACLFAQQQLVAQTMQCLEPLCAVGCNARGAEEQEISLDANILLAETCMVACSNSKKAHDRELWQRRVIWAETCIFSADSAMECGVPCSHEWKLRLFKAKFLLQQQAKIERSVRNRRMLELLCHALQCCAEAADDSDEELVANYRQYFGVKLKACLVKMHAATVMAKNARANSGVNSFVDNLTYVRSALPNYVDRGFLLWLVEVTCHTAISSFQPGDTAEMRQMVRFGQEFFDKVAEEQQITPEFRVYHLIITSFYYLRTGKIAKMTQVLDEIKALTQDADGNSDKKTRGMLKEAYLDNILDALRLNVVACSDPAQALTFAMGAIHAVQTSLQTYAPYPAVRLMLIAILFDMLHVYCRLLGLQCRYSEMGASIVQMTTLFATYKSFLEPTIFYRFFLARCHTLIAKYATAIGKVKDACAHLNYVVDKLLPAPSVDEETYPDSYLTVWMEVLDVATYCCGVATTPPSSMGVQYSNAGSATAVQIKQIYPSRVLLEWVARVLTLEGLQHHTHRCCSAELRAKYDLALAKWLWATQELPSGERTLPASGQTRTQHVALEALRPKMFSLLHDSLQRLDANVNCCETTSEIMALLGPQLIAYGKGEHGEETLTNAVRTALHSKDVLLQVRLLADIFELYNTKKLVQARATAAAKYEKKLALLRRRVAAAQAEEATTAALLRWTTGSDGGSEARSKSSMPSRG